MPVQKICLLFIILLFVMLSVSQSILAQSTAFSYQGRLLDSGNPANGQYDLQFKLFDTVTVGTGAQQGSTVTVSNVTVSNGSFSVSLDFGACPTCFDGSARFLEVAVKPTSGSTFTTLTPRQPINSTPYALKSLNATTADGLSLACVNCVMSNQIQSIQGSQVTGNIAGSQINGVIPLASIPAGSSNYIQNTVDQQANTNFNISGDGTAGGTLTGSIVNAVQQVNINGLRSFTVNGAFNDGVGTVFTASNTFTGDGAGVNTTPSPTLNNSNGKFNSFFGAGAGQANTTGVYNAFFGTQAGNENGNGFQNAFFGAGAGQMNTTQFANTFIGSFAGYNNGRNDPTNLAIYNTFVGNQAGYSNTTGESNAFFGSHAGYSNTTGNSNVFVGKWAGYGNTSGNSNAFFGYQAGYSNTSAFNAFFGGGAGFNSAIGSSNTFIGAGADFNTSNSTGNSNTLLGSSTHVNAGINNSTAIGANATVTQSNSLVLGAITGINGGTSVNVGIGTPAPATKLDIQGGNVAINNNLLQLRSASDSNHGMLYSATVDGPEFRGFSGFRWTNGTAGASERMRLDANGNLGIGTTAPAFKLHVNGEMRADMVSVGTYVSGGTVQVCVNTSNNRLAVCNSSLRYKTAVQPFTAGLTIINRLQPIRYNWKESGLPDIGLVAEAVEKVEPLLIFRNDKGEVDGVKYNQLSAVFINAFKEQQAQIKQQQTEIATLRQELRQVKQQKELIRQQQQEMATIKRLLCKSHPKASICKAKSLK